MASLFKATTTTVPLHKLLNAADKDERDKLTGQWRDHKLQELNFVGVVVSKFRYCNAYLSALDISQGRHTSTVLNLNLGRPCCWDAIRHRFLASHPTQRKDISLDCSRLLVLRNPLRSRCCAYSIATIDSSA